MHRFIIVAILLVIFASCAFCQTSGLFLEAGFSPEASNRGDFRGAVGLFSTNSGGQGGVLGSEIGLLRGEFYLAGYTEKSYSKRMVGAFGLRAAHRTGVAFLSEQERAGVLTGGSLSAFYGRWEVIGTYTAISYVRDSVFRSASAWHIGLATSIFWP